MVLVLHTIYCSVSVIWFCFRKNHSLSTVQALARPFSAVIGASVLVLRRFPPLVLLFRRLPPLVSLGSVGVVWFRLRRQFSCHRCGLSGLVFRSGCVGPVWGVGCFGLGGGVGGAAAMSRLRGWLCHDWRRCGEEVVVLLRWSRWVTVLCWDGVAGGGAVGKVMVLR
jgi:hypothetical protein